MEIKNQLKKKGISSRWVISKEKILSSVIVLKNKLLAEGVEFCFLLGTQTHAEADADTRRNSQRQSALSLRSSAYVGKTESCQQFEEYGQRDFGRPARNIEEGMLPPKLAKIMINLTQLPAQGTMLDPFCGSGTIIQEAMLMGYKNVIGCDISEGAVEATKANLNWFIKKLATAETRNDSESQRNSEIQNLQENISVYQSDVRNLSQKISLNSIDAIVTEPYLGPVKILNLKSQISNLVSELSDLYLKAFSEFKKILKSTGKIVIIFPVFSARGGSAFGGKTNPQLHFLPILDELKKFGWQIVNPIPPELRKNPTIKITARNSIIYSRPNQQVLREIFILEPTNY
jgi:tRNA G10  N-methylase Trm11